jgi:N-carbamoylputrescine amidase
MALAGAQILIYPTAIGWTANDGEAERNRQLDAWVTVQRSHAIANGVPVISVNRTGLEPDSSGNTQGIEFWGNSFAVGPQGEFLANASQDSDANLIVDIDLQNSENVRRWWPFLRDRRIDAYQELLNRYLD